MIGTDPVTACQILNVKSVAVRMVVLDGQPWLAFIDVLAALGKKQGGAQLHAVDADEQQTIRGIGDVMLKGHGLKLVSGAGVLQFLAAHDGEEADDLRRQLTDFAVD